MRHFTTSGDVSVSARAAARAAQAALKALTQTIDAKFLTIPPLAVALPGATLAESLHNLAKASGGMTAKGIEDAMDAVDAVVSQQVASAIQLLTKADEYAAALRGCAAHIEHGTSLLPCTAPDLAKAAAIMRAHCAAGDFDGQAKEVIEVLNFQADNAAAVLVEALDFARKYRTALSVAKAHQRGAVLKAMVSDIKRGHTVEPAAAVHHLETKQKAAERAHRAFKAVYQKAYLGQNGGTRRPPKMMSASPARITKHGKSFALIGGVQ